MSRRILQGSWWLLVLVLMNGFCGNMRASLMKNEKPELLRSFGDLAEQKKFLPLIVQGSAYDDFMGRADNSPEYKSIYRRCLEGGGHRPMRRMYSKETFDSLVKREGIYIGEESTFKQYLGSFCKGTSASESGLYVSEERVFPHCFSIGMSKAMDKNLVEAINLIISQVQQSAIMSLWLAEELRGWTRCTIEESVSEEEPLKFKNLSGIFYLYLVCLAIATFSFFCELFMNCFRKK